MDPITEPELLARLRRLAPFESEGEAERALYLVVSALGRLLTDDERSSVGRVLPRKLREALGATATANGLGESELFATVASWEGVPLGRAIEHTSAVCRALAELIGDESVIHLERALPQLASLFEIAPSTEAPPHDRSHGLGHVLSDARPGSLHSLASGDPARIVHHHSVARSDDPHADTRLSSAQGVEQEREGRTLSSGRPGASRPLSNGR